MNHFGFTFEIVSNDRVRVFLNDRSVGYVRLHDVRIKGVNVRRLTFRNSSSPFKSLIPTPSYTDLSESTVAELLTIQNVYRDVIAAAVRSSLYGHAEIELPQRAAA